MTRPELTVIVPSRGRPESMHRLLLEFQATCTASTRLLPVVDDNDPTFYEYPEGTLEAPSRNMVQALNWAAARVVGGATGHPAPFAVGFMGDDHRPITRGWDAAYLEALRELSESAPSGHGGGLVYGNDLLQGGKLPTQVAMTSNIPATLGYLAPPGLVHLYVDDVWKAWGERAGCLRYLPEIIVEHRHPVARKAEWDEGYRRVNSEDRYRADRQYWRTYQGAGLARDAAAIRALAGVEGGGP